MPTNIDDLRGEAEHLRNDGLNAQQIADELSLSQTTITWLLSGSAGATGDREPDVKIGWRTIGVRPQRIEAIGSVFADIVLEETDGEIDTIVGISLNGIAFAQAIASHLDCELAIYRNVEGELGAGHLSDKFGRVSGKKVAIVDDVLSSGFTMRKAMENLLKAGAEVELLLVLVNKTMLDEIDGVALRGLVRAISV